MARRSFPTAVAAAKSWAASRGWLRQGGSFYIQIGKREFRVMEGTWDALVTRLLITDGIRRRDDGRFEVKPREEAL